MDDELEFVPLQGAPHLNVEDYMEYTQNMVCDAFRVPRNMIDGLQDAMAHHRMDANNRIEFSRFQVPVEEFITANPGMLFESQDIRVILDESEHWRNSILEDACQRLEKIEDLEWARMSDQLIAKNTEQCATDLVNPAHEVETHIAHHKPTLPPVRIL